MCGRYVLKSAIQELARIFDARPQPGYSFDPDYNITPGRDLPVVLQAKEESQRLIRPHRWGLIPHWAKEEKMGYSMINARSETLAEKPSFRQAYRMRRCVVPADGFYEWKKTPDGKQPYYISHPDGRPMALAGLYERWTSPEERKIDSFTIITTPANKTLEPLHDRMPAILAGDEEVRFWLDPEEQNPSVLGELLRPWAEDDIRFYPVSKTVNNPRNQGSELIEPQEDLFGGAE